MPSALQNTQDTDPKPDTYHGKINIVKLLKWRHDRKLTFQEIADKFGCKKQSVHTAYHKFMDMFPNKDQADIYSNTPAPFITQVEYNLLQDLADPDKRKKASLNNVAYAFDKIHTARRLEEGKSTAGGVSVSIEIAYQAATDQAKQLRLRHAGASTTVDIDKNEPDD